MEHLDACPEPPTHLTRSLGVREVLLKPLTFPMLERAIEVALRPVEAPRLDLSRWHALRFDFVIATHSFLPAALAITQSWVEFPEITRSEIAADCAELARRLRRLALPLFYARGDAVTARRHDLRSTRVAAWLREADAAVDLPEVLVDPDALACAFPGLFAPSDADDSGHLYVHSRPVREVRAVARGVAPPPAASRWPVVRCGGGVATEWAELIVSVDLSPWERRSIAAHRDYDRDRTEMLLSLLQGAVWDVDRDDGLREIHIALPTAARGWGDARLDPHVEEHRAASLLCDEIERALAASDAIVELLRATGDEPVGADVTAHRDALVGVLIKSNEWLYALSWIAPPAARHLDGGVTLGELMARCGGSIPSRPDDAAAPGGPHARVGFCVDVLDPSTLVRGDERFHRALTAACRWLAYALSDNDGACRGELRCALGVDASSREALVVTAHQLPGVTPRVRGDDAWRAAADEVTFAGGEFDRSLDADGATCARFSLPLRSI
ncbi:MAG: hypothetical protein U0326_14220 [Polyangiales bacterium]